MLFIYLFFTRIKMFLFVHLKVSFLCSGTKKPLQPREPRQGTMLATEDSPTLSDEESEFSWRAYKARARLH